MKNLRLYVAEDSPDLKTLIVRTLTKNGYTVNAFDDGSQAFNQLMDDLEEHHDLPSLLITDVNMPVMTGYELIERLRKVHDFDKLPVLVYSSEKEIEDYKYDHKNHTHQMRKPSMPKALLEYIKKIVENMKLEPLLA